VGAHAIHSYRAIQTAVRQAIHRRQLFLPGELGALPVLRFRESNRQNGGVFTCYVCVGGVICVYVCVYLSVCMCAYVCERDQWYVWCMCVCVCCCVCVGVCESECVCVSGCL